jgi:hypothetical protein
MYAMHTFPLFPLLLIVVTNLPLGFENSLNVPCMYVPSVLHVPCMFPAYSRPACSLHVPCMFPACSPNELNLRGTFR